MVGRVGRWPLCGGRALKRGLGGGRVWESGRWKPWWGAVQEQGPEVGAGLGSEACGGPRHDPAWPASVMLSTILEDPENSWFRGGSLTRVLMLYLSLLLRTPLSRKDLDDKSGSGSPSHPAPPYFCTRTAQLLAVNTFSVLGPTLGQVNMSDGCCEVSQVHEEQVGAAGPAGERPGSVWGETGRSRARSRG